MTAGNSPGMPDQAGRAHAVVVDLAATWDDYPSISQVMAGAVANGLVLHAAGMTDDGFRTIDIWDSEDAWRCYQELLGQSFGELLMAPLVRELEIRHLIRGDDRVTPRRTPGGLAARSPRS